QFKGKDPYIRTTERDMRHSPHDFNVPRRSRLRYERVGKPYKEGVPMKRGFHLIGIGLAAALAACSQDSQTASDLPDDLLSTDADFIAVQRTSQGEVASAKAAIGSGPVVLQDGDHNFYLAIRRDSLAQRWFLSGYTKQFFPGDVNAFADSTLGTRVVSF